MLILLPTIFMCLLLAAFNFSGSEDLTIRSLVHYFFSAATTFTTLYILATVRQKMIVHHPDRLLEKSEPWNTMFKDNVFWGKVVCLQTVGCLFYTVVFLLDVMHKPFNGAAVMAIALSLGVSVVSMRYGYLFTQDGSALDFLDRGTVRLIFYAACIQMLVSVGLSPITGVHFVFMVGSILYIWLVSAISDRVTANVFRGIL